VKLLRHVALAIGLLLPVAAQAAPMTEVDFYEAIKPVVDGFWCGSISKDEAETGIAMAASVSDVTKTSVDHDLDAIFVENKDTGKAIVCSMATRSETMTMLKVIEMDATLYSKKAN
jgi:hypothetical protein